ncbi:UDP-glucuronosyltransferase 1-9 [Exaiptasia diaphana]|uniref:UDP-glucuronosyltransferase n=1 Tax=Exaiptasia diaphana TaxID=2652724 RepID=A0A913XJM3_EXADI|nr:UDP-glucuronosyltransferase 1-9 [Exaiptasia diaphana]
MNEAFSKLPQKVIWRLNKEKFEGKLASNTKTSRWLPQNDILGHPKTKLFITHAGASGLAEAVYHGVPMICSPFFGDQFDNARSVEYIGLGEMLSVKTTTADQLVEMINKVLTKKRYKEKAGYVSRVVKMRPRTALEEAAELIEYLHAVGNLAHLKPKGLELPFYQLYMLDVLLVLGIVFLLVLFIVVFVIKRVINFCCCRQKKRVINLCCGAPKKTKTS